MKLYLEIFSLIVVICIAVSKSKHHGHRHHSGRIHLHFMERELKRAKRHIDQPKIQDVKAPKKPVSRPYLGSQVQEIRIQIKLKKAWRDNFKKKLAPESRLLDGNVIDAVNNELTHDRNFLEARVLGFRPSSGKTLADIALRFFKTEEDPIEHLEGIVDGGWISSLPVINDYFKILQIINGNNENTKWSFPKGLRLRVVPAMLTKVQKNQNLQKKKNPAPPRYKEVKISFELRQKWYPFLGDPLSSIYQVLSGNINEALDMALKENPKYIDTAVYGLRESPRGFITADVIVRFTPEEVYPAQQIKVLISRGAISGLPVVKDVFEVLEINSVTKDEPVLPSFGTAQGKPLSEGEVDTAQTNEKEEKPTQPIQFGSQNGSQALAAKENTTQSYNSNDNAKPTYLSPRPSQEVLPKELQPQAAKQQQQITQQQQTQGNQQNPQVLNPQMPIQSQTQQVQVPKKETAVYEPQAVKETSNINPPPNIPPISGTQYLPYTKPTSQSAATSVSPEAHVIPNDAILLQQESLSNETAPNKPTAPPPENKIMRVVAGVISEQVKHTSELMFGHVTINNNENRTKATKQNYQPQDILKETAEPIYPMAAQPYNGGELQGGKETHAEGVKPLSQEKKPLSQEQKPLSQVGKPLLQVEKPLLQVEKPLSQVEKTLPPVGKPLPQVEKPLSQFEKPGSVPSMKPPESISIAGKAAPTNTTAETTDTQTQLITAPVKSPYIAQQSVSAVYMEHELIGSMTLQQRWHPLLANTDSPPYHVLEKNVLNSIMEIYHESNVEVSCQLLGISKTSVNGSQTLLTGRKSEKVNVKFEIYFNTNVKPDKQPLQLAVSHGDVAGLLVYPQSLIFSASKQEHSGFAYYNGQTSLPPQQPSTLKEAGVPQGTLARPETALETKPAAEQSASTPQSVQAATQAAGDAAVTPNLMPRPQSWSPELLSPKPTNQPETIKPASLETQKEAFAQQQTYPALTPTYQSDKQAEVVSPVLSEVPANKITQPPNTSLESPIQDIVKEVEAALLVLKKPNEEVPDQQNKQFQNLTPTLDNQIQLQTKPVGKQVETITSPSEKPNEIIAPLQNKPVKTLSFQPENQGQSGRIALKTPIEAVISQQNKPVGLPTSQLDKEAQPLITEIPASVPAPVPESTVQPVKPEESISQQEIVLPIQPWPGNQEEALRVLAKQQQHENVKPEKFAKPEVLKTEELGKTKPGGKPLSEPISLRPVGETPVTPVYIKPEVEEPFVPKIEEADTTKHVEAIGPKPVEASMSKPVEPVGTQPATPLGAKPVEASMSKPVEPVGTQPATPIGIKPVQPQATLETKIEEQEKTKYVEPVSITVGQQGNEAKETNQIVKPSAITPTQQNTIDISSVTESGNPIFTSTGKRPPNKTGVTVEETKDFKLITLDKGMPRSCQEIKNWGIGITDGQYVIEAREGCHLSIICQNMEDPHPIEFLGGPNQKEWSYYHYAVLIKISSRDKENIPAGACLENSNDGRKLLEKIKRAGGKQDPPLESWKTNIKKMLAGRRRRDTHNRSDISMIVTRAIKIKEESNSERRQARSSSQIPDAVWGVL